MIKHAHLRFGILVAVGFAVGLAANQAKPNQTKPPVARTMKLTGCIERGPAAGGSSTVVPPGSPTPPPMYKLTHVDANSLKSAMTSEDTNTAAGVASATEIALRADSAMKISDHVDHKVELTGRVVTDKMGSKASGRSAADASAAGMSVVPVFQVTSLKMVASSCQ
ncbi:MAG TPA: hypothetical protein VJN96_01650 [Vicinamibacterales bacterium]|nr:hypothetical protein [Vicinamibacterales bacterium]